MLFTGDTIATASTAVVGAYFPRAIHITSTKEEEEKGRVGTNNPHLLFQLQPKFCLLPWTKLGVTIKDLIKAEDDTVSLTEIATGEDLETHNLPYQIGGPSGDGGGLRIDPGKKMATLGSGDGTCYEDMGEEGCDGFSKNWDVTINNSRMAVFTITGDVGQELQSKSVAKDEDLPVAEDEASNTELVKVETSEDTGLRVEGEAFQKRIQGFGPR